MNAGPFHFKDFKSFFDLSEYTNILHIPVTTDPGSSLRHHHHHYTAMISDHDVEPFMRHGATNPFFLVFLERVHSLSSGLLFRYAGRNKRAWRLRLWLFV